MDTLQYIGFITCLTICGASEHLPKYIKACSKKDPNFNKCAMDNANAAIPVMAEGDRKFKMPGFKPLKAPYIVDIDTGRNLKLTLSDLQIYGFDKIKVIDLQFDFDKKTYFLVTSCPKVVLLGQYEMVGNLLVLKLDGHGAMNTTFVNVEVKYHCSWTTKNINGEDFLKITNSSANFRTDMVYFNFENLFNGNKMLGDEMNKFLNENWEDALRDLGSGLFKATAETWTRIHNKYFDKIPLKEIFLD